MLRRHGKFGSGSSANPAGLPPVRELRYDKGQTGTALLQRLRGIEFTLEEEGNLGITDVTEKFQQSLDIERVTKRFFDRFRNELTAFQKFINGFTNHGDRDWYASLMLNRMMFVYFIQKQLFLDGDEHYLGNRLKKVQEQDGPDQFMRFYRKFLLRLFHEGLGQPEADRSVELNALLGKVPYLNGGIFDPHTLERDNPDINIPDAAFEQIFLFFDQYQWHLDDRPSGADNEINPDVLGYIFEKYVNQKQMGAYYTKEDITGYIARNTVIPRLLEMAQTECPIAFGPDGGVWRLLQDDPDNYIYPAVGHGIAWDYSPESVSDWRNHYRCRTTSPAGWTTLPNAPTGTRPRRESTPCPPKPGENYSPDDSATRKSATSWPPGTCRALTTSSRLTWTASGSSGMSSSTVRALNWCAPSGTH